MQEVLQACLKLLLTFYNQQRPRLISCCGSTCSFNLESSFPCLRVGLSLHTRLSGTLYSKDSETGLWDSWEEANTKGSIELRGYLPAGCS